MTNAILLLKHEHRNFERLLDVLEPELERVERGDGADLEIIGSVAEYLREYPDQCHHPKEDVVYRRLCQRNSDSAAAISDLVADHQRLSAVISTFATEAARARSGAHGASASLVEAGRTVLHAYRRHMAAEERDFFPAALRCFSSLDWDAIDFTLFDSTDHVFDHRAEDRFASLRTRIDAVIEARRESRAHLAEVQWLYRVQGIDDFNAAMAGDGMRLERINGGGYRLLDGEETSIDLPETDESRAVWCAYYFLKGRRGEEVRAPVRPNHPSQDRGGPGRG